MTDFKGNELNVGDKVITISNYGHRYLEEGVVTRLTKMKAEVKVNGSSYNILKDARAVMKLA